MEDYVCPLQPDDRFSQIAYASPRGSAPPCETFPVSVCGTAPMAYHPSHKHSTHSLYLELMFLSNPVHSFPKNVIAKPSRCLALDTESSGSRREYCPSSRSYTHSAG